MTKLVDVGTIGCYFESLSDPRHYRNRKHLLVDIMVIAVAAIVCGCDGPTAIHRWARARRDWLAQYLTLPNGIPSRDCIRRVLLALRPQAFQRCFRDWVTQALVGDAATGGRLVAVDGKTCRRSHDAGKELGPLHIVSAWASEEGIALGQVATDSKSNEITAIPVLLEQLALSDAIVTIDALGCQKEIVQQIKRGGGDAIVAVKENQPKLHAAIAAYFTEQIERDFADVQYRSYESEEAAHGRIDERSYFLTKVPRDFAPAADWPEVKAIGYALRWTTRADGAQTSEVRYYVSTRYVSGKRFAEAVRGHWGIEALHWVLDVTFREDDSRTRERTLANNLSWLRRFAVTLLKRHPEEDSIRGKMLHCGYSTDFLTEVLMSTRV
jgi:predicted transposase YbfD/YdcC